MREIVSQTVDLDGLARAINSAHEAFEARWRRTLEDAAKIGHMLIEAKIQLKHSEWIPWLERNTVIPQRTASLYMRLAREAPEIGNVADLSIRGAIEAITMPTGAAAEPPASAPRPSQPVKFIPNPPRVAAKSTGLTAALHYDPDRRDTDPWVDAEPVTAGLPQYCECAVFYGNDLYQLQRELTGIDDMWLEWFNAHVVTVQLSQAERASVRAEFPGAQAQGLWWIKTPMKSMFLACCTVINGGAFYG